MLDYTLFFIVRLKLKNLFISILLCVSTFAFADTNFRFRKTDDGTGIYIDKYTGTDIVVYINSYYDGLPVKGIGERAFSGTNVADIVEVYLPETIEWIGISAFSGKRSLRTINFPNSLQIIWYAAFWNCRSLSQINFSYPLHKISWIGESCNMDAFSECSLLPMSAQLNLIKMGYDGHF